MSHFQAKNPTFSKILSHFQVLIGWQVCTCMQTCNCVRSKSAENVIELTNSTSSDETSAGVASWVCNAIQYTL